MAKLLIIYHSRTGGSEQMAHAAYQGAKAETEAILMKAEEVEPSALLEADGYVFVCPENLATISGQMKEFFDRCYYPVLGRLEGRPYTQMICAGSDGENAIRQIARIATGWRLKAVQEPLIICTHAQTETEILSQKTITPKDLQTCTDIGAALAAGLELGVF